MSQTNFTAGRVEALKCIAGKQQTIYWDGKTPGLALRVTKGGSKSFVFESRLNGKTIRVTIGDMRTWTIGKAQSEATRLKSLTDQGIDPRQLKIELAASNEAHRNEATRKEVTLADVWDIYINARRHKWSDRHLEDHKTLTRCGGGKVAGRDQIYESGVLAPLMTLKLSDIDSTRVKAWLRDEATNRPTQAALAFRLLRAFLNWCKDTPEYKGVAGEGACQTRIAKDVLPKQKAKTDCLQREQLPVWFDAVRKIENPVIASYLQILLLTGSRREELASLKWEDVDFKWHTITIRDKVEGERTIPLTPYVANLLIHLKRRNDATPPRYRIFMGKRLENDLENWKPSVLVFSSKTAKSGRLQEPRIQHNIACAIAGIESLTIHGLRRSFSTLSEWVQTPAGIVAQIMGHKPSATAEKHYKRRSIDLLRMWHTNIESWTLEQAGIKFQPEDVVLKLTNAT